MKDSAALQFKKECFGYGYEPTDLDIGDGTPKSDLLSSLRAREAAWREGNFELRHQLTSGLPMPDGDGVYRLGPIALTHTYLYVMQVTVPVAPAQVHSHRVSRINLHTGSVEDAWLSVPINDSYHLIEELEDTPEMAMVVNESEDLLVVAQPGFYVCVIVIRLSVLR